MIRVRGLTRSYGSICALRGVDLDVEAGESVTIVGPNGAGKTTLLRILATLLNPSSGEVRINGEDLSTGSYNIRARIGFASQQIRSSTTTSRWRKTWRSTESSTVFQRL